MSVITYGIICMEIHITIIYIIYIIYIYNYIYIYIYILLLEVLSHGIFYIALAQMEIATKPN